MSNKKYDRQAYRDGHKDGYRAAEQHIISWLRNYADNTYTFTAKKFADHIERGSHRPVKVASNETSNNPENVVAGNTNVDIVAMDPGAMVVAECSHEDCKERSSYAVPKRVDDVLVYTCYCDKHYDGQPRNPICSREGCLAPSDYAVIGEHDDKPKPLCAKHAFPDDTGERF